MTSRHIVEAQARAATGQPADNPALNRAHAALFERYRTFTPANRKQRRFFERALAYERRKDLVK